MALKRKIILVKDWQPNRYLNRSFQTTYAHFRSLEIYRENSACVQYPTSPLKTIHETDMQLHILLQNCQAGYLDRLDLDELVVVTCQRVL